MSGLFRGVSDGGVDVLAGFSVIRWFDRGRKAATLEEPSGDPPPEIQIKSSVKKDPVGFQDEPDSVQTADPIGPGPRPRSPPPLPPALTLAPGGLL